MESPLISVIVPVYGVELYLEQCIESLTNQTYHNLQIILIDDGGKDRCPNIIDEWAKRDERILVVHQSNQGQSAARNAAVKIATGQYIMFVDGDDWIDSNCIYELYKGISASEADLAISAVNQIKNGKRIAVKFCVSDEFDILSCTREETVKFILEKNIAVIGHLYRSSLIKPICFPEGRKAEEYLYHLELLQHVERACFCRKAYYNYVIRDESDSHGVKPEYLLDNIQALLESYHICKTLYPYETDFCCSRLATLLYNFMSAKKYGAKAAERRKKILQDAIEVTGNRENLIKLLETPLDTVFYTYSKFGKYMDSTERKTCQRDFRKIYKEVEHTFGLKYLLGYVSLPIAAKVGRLKH